MLGSRHRNGQEPVWELVLVLMPSPQHSVHLQVEFLECYTSVHMERKRIRYHGLSRKQTARAWLPHPSGIACQSGKVCDLRQMHEEYL